MPLTPPHREAAHNATRENILSVAERMFADYGISGVSLRGIISEAGVNTAAVHYHFGSKEKLVAEVFLHRAGQIADERNRLLEEARKAPAGRPRLHAILYAFLKPGLLGGADSPDLAERYARFRARLMSENLDFMRDLMARSFDESSRAFVDALAETLPGFSRDEILWRMHCLLGIGVYTMSGTGRINAISRGACDPTDHVAALERLVPITADIFAPGLPQQSG